MLGGTSEEWKDITFLRNGGQKAAWVAAISDRFKLVVSINEKPWLFDHQNDPDELKNFFGTDAAQAIAQSMAQDLLSYGESNEDPFIQGNAKIREQLLAIARP